MSNTANGSLQVRKLTYAAVCLALLIWFGISAVTTVQKNAEAAAAEKAAAPIELNVDGYMDYISGLQVSY